MILTDVNLDVRQDFLWRSTSTEQSTKLPFCLLMLVFSFFLLHSVIVYKDINTYEKNISALTF